MHLHTLKSQSSLKLDITESYSITGEIQILKSQSSLKLDITERQKYAPKIERDFKGTAKLEPLEGQLVLNIAGDGLGYFEVKCKASDQPGFGGTLSFSLSFDQTELARLLNELDKITKAFPIRGDFSIENE